MLSTPALRLRPRDATDDGIEHPRQQGCDLDRRYFALSEHVFGATLFFAVEIVYRKPFAPRKTFRGLRGRTRFIEGDTHGRTFENLSFCDRLNGDIVDHDDKTARGIVDFDRAMRDACIV